MKVAVVGGGVVGLSVAWAASEAGHQVQLIDAAPGSGASWVAGGMLAPVTEAWPGEEHVLALGSASLDRWPEFAARLEKMVDYAERGPWSSRWTRPIGRNLTAWRIFSPDWAVRWKE